jgi:hypothetical protein
MQSPSFGCVVFFVCLFFFCRVRAQETIDTEFRKGWVTHLYLDNGVISNFHAAPDVYVGGAHLNQQYTIVPHKLRAGANAGFVYANKKFSGIFGPSVAFKIKSINLDDLGGLANLQLTGNHSWGTDEQRMIGLGMGLELLQKMIISLSTHRDYHLNNWWIQAHIGINLKKSRAAIREFNQ